MSDTLGVIYELARETLRTRDDLIERGWVVAPMPHESEVRAALEAEPAAGLDVAWVEVEAALPEGWRLERLDLGVWGSWWAYAGRGSDRIHAEADTPAAALLALAARLASEPKPLDVDEEIKAALPDGWYTR